MTFWACEAPGIRGLGSSSNLKIDSIYGTNFTIQHRKAISFTVISMSFDDKAKINYPHDIQRAYTLLMSFGQLSLDLRNSILGTKFPTQRVPWIEVRHRTSIDLLEWSRWVSMIKQRLTTHMMFGELLCSILLLFFWQYNVVTMRLNWGGSNNPFPFHLRLIIININYST